MRKNRYPTRNTRKTRSVCVENDESQTNVECQSQKQSIQIVNFQKLYRQLIHQNRSYVVLQKNSKYQNLQRVVFLTMRNKDLDVYVDISGVPGVGKTASIMEIIQNLKKSISHRKVAFKYVNSMNLSVPTKIYSAMNNEFFKSQKQKISQNPAIKLFQKLQNDKRIKILVIDQIDYLYTKSQTILYNLFEWCNDSQTRLCLIVVANTMDFPEKLQRKITSRMGNNRLVFKPYSHNEVRQIIQQRLMKSNRFSNDAIQYACKKMASYTSDVRKLLDILRRALEIKKQGTVSIEDMTHTWRVCAQESGDLWQEHLQQNYKNLIQIIKDCGGVANQYQIHQRMQARRKCTATEILINVKQMEQMGLVKIKEKNKKILHIYEVTLLKI